LIEKVKNKFTEYEQQMFLASFYCYLKYDYKNDFVIDLDNVWKWLEFSNKAHAKTVLTKHFKVNTDYKFLLTKMGEQKKDSRGGHNKEIIMLNINTFKKICLKSETKKANEIHDYFIKLEEILQEVLLEESNELKLQLEQQKTEMQLLEDIKNKELEEKLIKQKIIEREKMLLNEYATIGSIVYIIKVKSYDNGQYIIKIGESRKGIKNRYIEHKGKYEECVLLDCFCCNKSKDFESFIHNHESIRLNKVNNLQGHETEMELFLVGKNLSYQTLLNIINNNIKYFNDNNNSKLELEIEQLKLMLEMKNTNNDNILIYELIQNVKQLTNKIDILEQTNKDIIEKLNASNTKVTNGFNIHLSTLGPRLQKINPDNLQLVKVYESVTEAMKENHNIKRPSINKAIVENTIYCGYRWLLVDRDLDPNIIHSIKHTKQTKVQCLGYIAQLNKENTEIINVYLDRKTAAYANGYESISALDNPVKNNTMTKGFYYKLYEKCDVVLREKFEEKINGKPLLYKNGIGQYDLQNNLTCEFECKYDCIKKLQISDKTLSKSLNQNISYNGFYYKELGSKLHY
jgi:phage anti-repressor protein